MLKFRPVYRCSANWPIVDLLDYNYQIQLLKSKPIKPNIQSLLGPNYNQYNESSFLLEYTSHLKNPKEVQVISETHQHFKQNDRLFETYDDLLQVRETESINKQKFVLKDLETNGLFTIDAMQHYKPRLTCDNLQSNQLLLINIPIDATSIDIQEFVKQITHQDVQVEIHTCSININAYATLTFKESAEQFKSQLHLSRFKNILQECKSVLDTAEQDAFNRTLVLTNIDKTLSLQQVLHYVGQYGRVINAVVPLEIQNPDLPYYSEVIDTLTDPCKLEILNPETGKIDIEFKPSFEEFERLYKQYPEYYDQNIQQTIFEYQQQQDEQQDQLRLYRLLNQKTIKCLKGSRQNPLWIPPINVENPPNDSQSTLYAKTYQNRGYCVITFSSKAMAQRALLAINQEGTHSLEELPLPLLNTINFYPENTSHSNQEKYGGKFRIENLAYTKVRAMKSWNNLELYQVDLIYNLKQLEIIRKKISQVRDQTMDALNTNDNDIQTAIDEKKQKVTQKVYSELSKSQEFKNFIDENSFSKLDNQFQDNFEVQPENKPGRKFDLNIEDSQYQSIINKLRDKSQQIKLKQVEYADKLVEKYQTLYLPDQFERDQEKKIIKNDDNLLSLMQTRLLSKAVNDEQAKGQNVNVQQSIFINHMRNQAQVNRNNRKSAKMFVKTDKKGKIMNYAKKLLQSPPPKNKFSTFITNPFYLKKQAFNLHEQFLDQIKRLLLGEECTQETLIAIHPLTNKDQLKLSKALAQDNQGNDFLNDEVIEYVKQFDIPVGQADLIRQQVSNRKQLMDQITQDQLVRIKQFSKQTYTQKLIYIDKHGVTTETFEVTDPNTDLEQMVNDLNTFVAIGTEKYEYVEDKLTSKRYIIKNEKPFFKYDLDAFTLNQQSFDQMEQEFIQLLTKNGFSEQQALQMLSAVQNDGYVPTELLDLIDKLPEQVETDPEGFYKNQGLTRKQYELGKSLDYRNNFEEIQNDINQQAYLKSVSKKYSPLTNDTFVRDQDQGKLKIKRKGKFLVPKQKKY